jgi:hypothetical protein
MHEDQGRISGAGAAVMGHRTRVIQHWHGDRIIARSGDKLNRESRTGRPAAKRAIRVRPEPRGTQPPTRVVPAH